MSKGNAVWQVRISPDMVREIEKVIAARNERAFGVPWNRTDFLTCAIREKLAHMKRARKRKKKAKGKGTTAIVRE